MQTSLAKDFEVTLYQDLITKSCYH